MNEMIYGLPENISYRRRGVEARVGYMLYSRFDVMAISRIDKILIRKSGVQFDGKCDICMSSILEGH
jgi:hypothetical protein